MNRVKTVAIIGGGVSGLSAGGLLSRKGLSVKLFEANGKLGGSCANTSLGGFTFHDGALYLAFPGILEHVFEKLDLDRSVLLPLRKITANQRTTLADGTVVSFGSGLDVTVHGRNENARTSQLQKELGAMLRKWGPLFRLFSEDILLHPFSVRRLFTRGWRELPKLHGTVASEIRRLFSDEAVRAAMSGVLMFSGTSPERTPVQAILALVAMITEGFYLPEGGMGQLPLALSRALKLYGGEACLKSTVNRIVTRGGRVSGLEVEGQGLVEADAVISTASGMVTFGSLLDQRDVPSWMQRKVQGAPLSHKAAVVQLGLSNVVEAGSHNNSVLPMMDEQYRIFTPNDDEVRWPVYSVPTVTLPSLAPPGGSVIEMFPPIAQDVPAGDWDEQRKEHVVASAVKALSRLHRLDIAVMRVLSPRDFQNRMHLYKGAIYGLSPTADLRAQFPHTSPISGLYQAGQTTYPGYGVSSAAMSGILAAEALLRMSEL